MGIAKKRALNQSKNAVPI